MNKPKLAINKRREVRPEYLKKLKRIRSQKGIPFKNIEELRKAVS